MAHTSSPVTSAVVVSLTTRVDRLGASASAAALLLVELVYVGLHFKPLEPLLPGSSGVADRGFLHAYTSAAFFSSELALLLLLGTVQPFRWPRVSAVQHFADLREMQALAGEVKAC